jgi:hypothetical protein
MVLLLDDFRLLILSAKASSCLDKPALRQKIFSLSLYKLSQLEICVYGMGLGLLRKHLVCDFVDIRTCALCCFYCLLFVCSLSTLTNKKLLLLISKFKQSIYNYMPETNRISGVQSVAGVLW